MLLCRLALRRRATAFLVAVPAIIFYFILFRHVVNVPMNDDYDALLNFSNHLADAPTLASKAYYFLISQHNEYKLFFEHALFGMQLELSGHIDLTLLCIIGNSFVLWIAILLWKMFLPSHEDLAARLTLFIPIPWLLFQLQYAQTLNFAMGALQNLPVLLFSLGTIYLLLRGTRWAFCGSVACLVLAVCSSGNGLLMIPIGMLILALSRKYKRMSVWAAVSAACIAAYFYHYDTMLWLSPHRSSFPSMAQFWRPYYAICFLGSAGGSQIKSASLVLGIAICVFNIYLMRRGYLRKSPMVGYSVLFVLLTSMGVAGIRSHFGATHSLSSRYTIYSTLLLIFAWFAIVEEWVTNNRRPLRHNPIFLSAATIAIVFSIAMDVSGLRFLVKRNRDLVVGMSLYERDSTQQRALGPVFPPPKSEPEQAFNLRAREILTQSAKLGIYLPPVEQRSASPVPTHRPRSPCI